MTETPQEVGGDWLRGQIKEAGYSITSLAREMAGEGAGHTEIETTRKKITRYTQKDADWFLVELLRTLGISLERGGEAVTPPATAMEAELHGLREQMSEFHAAIQELARVLEERLPPAAEPSAQ